MPSLNRAHVYSIEIMLLKLAHGTQNAHIQKWKDTNSKEIDH